MEIKCLFIGGCADGQWHKVNTDYPTWVIPERSILSSVEITVNVKIDQVETLKHNIYKKMSWRSNSVERFIYIYENIDTKDVLDMLLNGYRG